MNWRSPRGVACEACLPRTAADWLEPQQGPLAVLGLDEAEGRTPDPQQVRALLDWAARHTRSVDGDTGPARDLLDERLTAPDLVVYASRIVNSTGLPERVLAHTERTLHVIADDGCECRMCAPRNEAQRPVERPRRCRFYGVPDAVHGVVGRWWPIRETVDLDSPVWAYQLGRQWSAARGKRAQKEARARQNAESAIQELKMRGLA